jgi:site-specific DNA recombinase
MTRVCLYTRISTDEENQPTSLASQHERLEAFCQVQEDWRIIAHHEDRATGTKLDRPGLQAALDLARQGRIDQLLVYRIDRLSRKVRQLASIAEELDTLNVVLRSATEPFDTGSAAGRMMLQMLGVFAEFEHATIVDRVTSGIERRAREGRWPNGRIPFGYARNEQKQLIPDERTAPVIRRIFTRYAAGRLGAAANRKTPRRRTRARAVAWLATQHRALGTQQRGIRRACPLARSDVPRPARAADRPGHLRPGTSTTEQRGEDLAMRAASRAEFLLTGLVRCGRCRRAYVGMSAKGNGGTYHYYACSGRQKLGRKSCDGERIPREKLEAAILTQLTSIYRDGGLIRDAIEQAAASDDTDRTALTEQRASLAKEITRSERAIDRYQDAFEAGDLNPAHFNERLTTLKGRLDALHDQDQALAHDLAVDTPTTPDAAALRAVADQLDHVIEHGEPEQAKALLAILIAELRIDSRNEIMPTYRVGAPVVCAPNSSVGEPALRKPGVDSGTGDPGGVTQLSDRAFGCRTLRRADQPHGLIRAEPVIVGGLCPHLVVGPSVWSAAYPATSAMFDSTVFRWASCGAERSFGMGTSFVVALDQCSGFGVA